MTGYNLRFQPSLQHFRELIQQKRVGRIFSVRAEIGQYLPGWRPAFDYRETVSAKAALGGGVLLELSHEIDYLRWLFGEVEWVSAVLRRQSNLEIDVEDTAHLILGFKSEGNVPPIVAALDMDFIRHDTARTCTVIGETGTLRWNALTGTVDIFDQGTTGWKSLFSRSPQRDESYLAQWRNFLACVEGKNLPLASGHDGLVALQIIEAARRSSVAGVVTKLTLSNNS